jgi:hypothetical protein
MMGAGMMGMAVAFIIGMGIMYVGKDKIQSMLGGMGATQAARARARYYARMAAIRRYGY